MNAINQRINKIVVEIFNDNNSKFAKLLGTSEANVRNYRLKTEPKIDVINKIVRELEISYEWLMTGEGSMKSDTYVYNVSPPPVVSPVLPYISEAHRCEYKEMLEKEKAEVKSLNREIGTLEEKVSNLTRENEYLKCKNSNLKAQLENEKKAASDEPLDSLSRLGSNPNYLNFAELGVKYEIEKNFLEKV